MSTNALVKQIVRDLDVTFMPDNATHKFRFQIKSETSNNLYTVALRKTSLGWECSCRGWIIHRKCKHLTTMMPVLLKLSAGTERQKTKKELAAEVKRLKGKA